MPPACKAQLAAKEPTVVIVSTCYSGSFATGKMARPNRVILTAARGDRPSFGCQAHRIYNFFDECLLGALPQGATWRSVSDGADRCVRGMEHALFTERVRGAVNLTAPAPVRNAEFAATLGRVLGRPAVLPVPAFALELLYGARYSPHDNPVERIWAALKNYVANTAVTWPGRLRQIHSFFRSRSPDQMLATAAPWTSPWLPPGYEQNFWNAA